MRFRSGLIVGLAVGYVVGTRAGRERYTELQAMARNLLHSDAAAKVRAGFELGIERLRGSLPRDITDEIDLVSEYEVD
jgi:hypothetical protein